MKRLSTYSLACAAALLLGSASSHAAAFIVTYNFTGGSAAGTSSGAGSANVTPLPATVGAGLPTGGFSSGTDSTFARASELTTQATTTEAAEAGAFAGNDYFEFTINAAAGFRFDLDTISLDVGSSNGGTLSGYIGRAFVRSNAELADYTTTLGGQDTPSSTGAAVAYTAPPLSIDVSSNTDFDGLTTLTVRIYNYNIAGNFTSPSDASQFTRMDNVVFSGDVALIPEPSTVLLLLGGLGSLIAVRRRRGSKVF